MSRIPEIQGADELPRAFAGRNRSPSGSREPPTEPFYPRPCRRSNQMPLLDDQGRLFGYVNVVDALVVLLVLAVGVAGLALVFGGEPAASPDAPEYTRVTVGNLQPAVALAFAEAENATRAGSGAVYDIADTHLTSHPSGEGAAVTATVRRPAGADPVAIGAPLDLEVATHAVNTSVAGFQDEPGLPTTTATVLAETVVSPPVAAGIRAGDTHRIGSTAVATVTATRPLGLENGSRRLLLGLELAALDTGATPRYATRPLRLGTTFSFRTAEYALTGRVVDLRTARIPTANRTVRVTATVDRSTADAVTTGDAIRAANRTLATITDVAAYPTLGGDRRRLALGVAVRARLVDGVPMLLANPLRVGSEVTLPATDVTVSGNVTGVGPVSGESTTARIDVAWRNVPPSLAAVPTPGLAEAHRGAATRITEVNSEPATVVLVTERGDLVTREHPVNRDVHLTLETTTRRNGETLWFHGRPIQRGDRVALDFGSITVRGNVTGVHSDG